MEEEFIRFGEWAENRERNTAWQAILAAVRRVPDPVYQPRLTCAEWDEVFRAARVAELRGDNLATAIDAAINAALDADLNVVLFPYLG
jgi:hypothetical protein